MRLRLAGCKELSKRGVANNYLSRRKSSSRNNQRDNRRGLQNGWYISVGGCVGVDNPLGLIPCLISGGVHTD
jgi:hypothetical protein